jgi:endonuclease-3 related protein
LQIPKTTITDILKDVYSRLLEAYGPQHWWPADGRFEVMVGAVLTQSTAWTNVAKAIRNLKTANSLSPEALRRLSLSELAALIRPSGYYTAKSLKLKALASWVGEHNDDLAKTFAENTQELRQELLSVYGIGEETADSILLYASCKPVFVVDAYTKRIVDRVGVAHEGTGYTDYQRLFSLNLPADVAMFNEYHALLVEHGKRSCRKDPLCPDCCLLRMCEHGLQVANVRLSTR